MADIFHNPMKSIPRSDPRVERIDLTKSDLGARPGHVKGLHKKNDNSIVHTKGAK